MFIMLHLVCDTVYAQMTVIRPADMDALQNALDNNNVSVISFHCPWLWQQKTYIIKCSLILWPCQVSLFFTETPTNPFLRCIDVEHVSNMCRSKGALLCIDSTFASPINQKALTLGADLVIHSATKYIAGHNDVSWYTGDFSLCAIIKDRNPLCAPGKIQRSSAPLLQLFRVLHATSVSSGSNAVNCRCEKTKMPLSSNMLLIFFEHLNDFKWKNSKLESCRSRRDL